MALEQKIALKLAQKLVMTPSLQQAIKLLQMTTMELEAVVSQELIENPVLEESEVVDPEEERLALPATQDAPPPSSESLDAIDVDAYFGDLDQWDTASTSGGMSDGEAFPFESMLTKEPDLQHHLLWQLQMGSAESVVRTAAEFIIGNIDADGFLCVSEEELREALKDEIQAENLESALEQALALVRGFDPAGVGFRTLRESLVYQLELQGEEPGSLPLKLLDHWELFSARKFEVLMKLLGLTLPEFRVALERVSSLNTRPGRGFDNERAQYVEPDVYVIKTGGEYIIQLNDAGLPRLRISRTYRSMLQSSSGNAPQIEAKSYLREKMRSALWLIKSLDQRQRTIYKVANSIVSQQLAFLEMGVEALRPMILRDVADDIGMHESTVSRVVSNKYIHTPQGLFPMKFFFHSGIEMDKGGGISSLTVKQKIKMLVSRENPKSPLSDSDIMKHLKSDGIQIARRTIAKYRDELGIQSSSERKRVF